MEQAVGAYHSTPRRAGGDDGLRCMATKDRKAPFAGRKSLSPDERRTFASVAVVVLRYFESALDSLEDPDRSPAEHLEHARAISEVLRVTFGAQFDPTVLRMLAVDALESLPLEAPDDHDTEYALVSKVPAMLAGRVARSNWQAARKALRGNSDRKKAVAIVEWLERMQLGGITAGSFKTERSKWRNALDVK